MNAIDVSKISPCNARSEVISWKEIISNRLTAAMHDDSHHLLQTLSRLQTLFLSFGCSV